MLRPSSRAVAVAMTVYPLRQVLIRSLHASSSALAGRQRGAPRPPPSPMRSSPAQTDRPSGVPTSAAALMEPKPARLIRSGPGSGPGAFASSRSGRRLPRRAAIATASARKLAKMDDGTPRPRKRPKRSFKFEATTYALPPSSAPASHAKIKRFDEFEVHPMMLPAVYQKLGDHPKTTPIQSLAFNHFFPFTEPGQRVLLGAETGSGKTLAFLVPMMSQLKLTEGEYRKVYDQDHKYSEVLPRSIVLSPTHELTRQTTGMAKNIVHSMKLSVLGMSQTKDGGIGTVRGVKDVFLGTVAMTRRMLGVNKPGDERNQDRMRKAWVVPDKLEWLVIDEADVLLGKDFQQETLAVIKHLAENRPDLNIVFCTATVPPALLQLLSTDPFFSQKPFTHLLSPNLHKLPSSLEARFVKFVGSVNPLAQVGQELKRTMAEDARQRRLRMESGSAINRSKYVVFCNSDTKVRALKALLDERMGIPTIAWTGDAEHRIHGKNGPLGDFLLKPKERPVLDANTEKVDKAMPRVLVTTSILSRGLDFHPLVSAVMLVDEPRDVLDFVHRAGRAGRAGRDGKVVVFGSGQRGQKTLTERVGALAGLPPSRNVRRGGASGRRPSSGRTLKRNKVVLH